ncbi:GAF domain-containing protein [Tumidithrix elongata RA019]|uniref:GAF domain-containing protein n=1 Tax=Tumidithrix elongata BACA0141 TaxID=2716417 RepID=A0AAW9PXE2_9CYAN|nr:GAF domain-containing protein [Tumidithrix elongata RA019]
MINPNELEDNLESLKIQNQQLAEQLLLSQLECSQIKQKLEELETQELEKISLIVQLLEVGLALSSIKDLKELLSLILSKSREITCSDAGSIYLIDRTDSVDSICFEVSQNDSQPQRSLTNFAMPMSPESLVGYVAITGEVLNLPDVKNIPSHVSYQHYQAMDRDIEYITRSVVVVPMQGSTGNVIGVMQLINRKVKPDILITDKNVNKVTQSYSDWEVCVLRSLASQAALCIERNQLMSRQLPIAP